METLADKTILISGGTTGIGRVLAGMVARRGGRVFTFGRHQQPLDETLALLEGGHDRHAGTVVDVSRSEEVRRAFQEAKERFGPIHGFVSCAAIGWSLPVESEEEEWEYVLRTNLLGTIACVREAVLQMKPAGRGHIVLVGSLSAEVQEPTGSMYVASKCWKQSGSRKRFSSL